MSGEQIDILILLIVANGAPILLARLLGDRFSLAVDFGAKMPDGKPVFGPAKTWRGIAAAMILSAAVSHLLGHGAEFGAVLGVLAMAGDLVSSFIKRQLGFAASARFPGLDQLPEALLPATYATVVLGHSWWWAVLLALLFMVLAVLVSKPLFWLNIRKRPY